MIKLLELKRPRMVAEAAAAGKGLHIALEVLVFIAVFIVCSLAQLILLIAGEAVLILSNKDYRQAAIAGDTQMLMQSNGMLILMLFTDAVMILMTLLFCKLIQKRKMATLGFRKPGMLKEYFVGLGAGLVLFSAAVLLCVTTGSLKFHGISSTFSIGVFVLFLLGFMVQGMAEEVLCRGYFLVSVGRRYPLAVGILANSLLFAALHLSNGGISVLAFLNLVLFGVFASVYFIKRGNIWGVGALHSIWNLAQGNLYGIRVSGMQVGCSLLSSEMVTSRKLINGGDFGLEGGLAVTLVLTAGTLIMLATRQQQYTEDAPAAEHIGKLACTDAQTLDGQADTSKESDISDCE